MPYDSNDIEARKVFAKIVSGDASKEEIMSLDGMESYPIPSEKEMNECEESLIQNPQANL